MSGALPMDKALTIRLRALFNIGEFMLANPRDVLSNSFHARRKPGLGRLHIFFRHVHMRHHSRSRDPNKSRPEWFSHQACFANLLRTLEESSFADRVCLTVVYDGTEADLASDFVARYQAQPSRVAVTVKLIHGGSNIKSWLELLEMVKSDTIPEDDVIFFMENDYLHVNGWLDKVVELYDSPIVFDYVSLYDHPDFYEVDGKPVFPAYRGLRAELHVTRTHHWRDAPSTCGTFLVKKKVFIEDIDVWSSRLSDFYAFAYLRTIKRRVLVNPVPGLGTHCMRAALAPTIDWAAQ
ncbi:MAG: hypothetical protein HY906_26180 [Deltaproteobacteria bacterium]|nr:hypothetical protein [Deltaproteobacteria bacterium]